MSPVTVAPSEALDDAMELMARHKVRRLPVVDGGRLVGVVSQADIALGAKEAKTGAVVEQISQPTSVAASVSYPAAKPSSAASTSRGSVARL